MKMKNQKNRIVALVVAMVMFITSLPITTTKAAETAAPAGIITCANGSIEGSYNGKNYSIKLDDAVADVSIDGKNINFINTHSFETAVDAEDGIVHFFFASGPYFAMDIETGEWLQLFFTSKSYSSEEKANRLVFCSQEYKEMQGKGAAVKGSSLLNSYKSCIIDKKYFYQLSNSLKTRLITREEFRSVIENGTSEVVIPTPAPKTEAPVVETVAPAPKTEAPVVETVAPAPKTEAPVVETVVPAPKTEAPVVETVAPAPTDAIHADVDTHREIDGTVDWKENINGKIDWSEKDHTDINWDSKTDVNWNSKTDVNWNSQTDANVNWQEKEMEKTDSQWTEKNQEVTKSVTDNTYDANNNLIHSETTTTTTGQKDGASTATTIGEEIGKAIINAVTSGNAVTNQTGSLQAEQTGKATVDTTKEGEATFEVNKDGEAEFHVNDDSHTEINVVVPSGTSIVIPEPAPAPAPANIATAPATTSKAFWYVKRYGKEVRLMKKEGSKKPGQKARIKFVKKKKIAIFDRTKYKGIIYAGYTAKSRQVILIRKDGKVLIVARDKSKTGKIYKTKIINTRKWKAAIEDHRGLVIRISDKKGHVKGVRKAQPKVVKK